MTYKPVLCMHVPQGENRSKSNNREKFLKKKKREKIFPVGKGKCVLLWLRGPIRNLALLLAASFTVTRPASAGQGSGDRGPCAKFTSHIQVFFATVHLLPCGWLVTFGLVARFLVL